MVLAMMNKELKEEFSQTFTLSSFCLMYTEKLPSCPLQAFLTLKVYSRPSLHKIYFLTTASYLDWKECIPNRDVIRNIILELNNLSLTKFSPIILWSKKGGTFTA